MPEGAQGHVDTAEPHELLARAVPVTARTVLQIGRGEGWIAASLQASPPGAGGLRRRLPRLGCGRDRRVSTGTTSSTSTETSRHSIRGRSTASCTPTCCPGSSIPSPPWNDTGRCCHRRGPWCARYRTSSITAWCRGSCAASSPTSPARCSIRRTSGSSPRRAVMQLLLDAGYAPDTVGQDRGRRLAARGGRRRSAVRTPGRGRQRCRARPPYRPG